MITIPCDYQPSNCAPCENGVIHDYGDQSCGIPWNKTTCPKCKGTGKYDVEESVIRDQIKDLVEERDEATKEIYRLRRLLFKAGKLFKGQKDES